MDQPKPIASVYLITVFIIEESGDIFQGLRNRALDSRSFHTLPRAAASATTTWAAAALIHEKTVARLDLCEALPRQDIAYIYWARCTYCI